MKKKENNKREKTVEQYRRDIYSLKTKLKSEQQYLEQLKQKYSDLDVFGEQGYTFSMKMKILECKTDLISDNLVDVKTKMDKYNLDPAFAFYQLNFSTFALIKSCEIVGINLEMIFRAVDIQNKNVVSWFDMSNFFKETLRLNPYFTNPILKVLDPKETTQITKNRFDYYLSVFVIKKQDADKKLPDISQSILNVCRELIKANIQPSKIWKQKQLNIATCAYGIFSQIKQIDPLDCIAVYCKSDPMKQGIVETSLIVNLLKHRINDVKNFKQGDKFRISKQK